LFAGNGEVSGMPMDALLHVCSCQSQDL